MSGTLYLCATPIGNLEDMTFRCVRILKEVDLIAAEDTRNSIKLLNHFDIHTPMTSYHEYNKIAKAHTLIEHLENGEDIALITDAGTPGISDPGEELVAMCQEAGITVTAVPGAAACITALTISGLSTRRFAFEAFLPTDKKERQAVLNELTEETRTMIIYEAPHRLVRTLELLLATLGDRRIRICRELTKKHETVFATTISAAVEYYKEQEPKGECVLVIEGKSRQEQIEEERQKWEEMSIQEHMDYYMDQGIQKKEAMKMEKKKHNKNVALVAAIFLILLTISYRSSLINERFNEIQNSKEKLASIQKTNGQLEVSIESSLNLSNVKNAAKDKLGMQELDNGQKVYVTLDKKDYVEGSTENIDITSDSDKSSDTWYKKIINKILGK